MTDSIFAGGRIENNLSEQVFSFQELRLALSQGKETTLALYA